MYRIVKTGNPPIRVDIGPGRVRDEDLNHVHRGRNNTYKAAQGQMGANFRATKGDQRPPIVQFLPQETYLDHDEIIKEKQCTLHI